MHGRSVEASSTAASDLRPGGAKQGAHVPSDLMTGTPLSGRCSVMATRGKRQASCNLGEDSKTAHVLWQCKSLLRMRPWMTSHPPSPLVTASPAFSKPRKAIGDRLRCSLNTPQGHGSSSDPSWWAMVDGLCQGL